MKGRKLRPLTVKKLQVLHEDGDFVCYLKGKRVGTWCVWCRSRATV